MRNLALVLGATTGVAMTPGVSLPASAGILYATGFVETVWNEMITSVG